MAGDNRLDGTLPAGIAQMAALQELYAFCRRLWRVRPPMVGCRNVTFNLLEGDVTTFARMGMNVAYVPPFPRPVVLTILDGVGWGRRDDTDAVAMARTPDPHSASSQFFDSASFTKPPVT